MVEKKPDTASQMLECLNEFLLGEEPDFKSMPADEVTAYLEKGNLDAGRVFKAAKQALESAHGRQELARAREKRLRVQENLPTPKRAPSLRQSLLQQIETLAGAGAAAVYARKFEDSPDEDLQSLIEDLELLEQLDFDDDEE